MSYNVSQVFDAVEKVNADKRIFLNRNCSFVKEILENSAINENAPEVELVKLVTFFAAGRAVNISEDVYENSHLQDVYRHAYWAMLLKECINAYDTERILRAYEDLTPNNDSVSKEMDLINNSKALTLSHFEVTDEIKRELIETAVEEGLFVIILNGELHPSSLLGTAKGYRLNSGIFNLDTYKESDLITPVGLINENEVVEVIDIVGISAKIEYHAGNVLKTAYIPLTHLSDQKFWKFACEQVRFIDGLNSTDWYVPNLIDSTNGPAFKCNDWRISQTWDDPNSSVEYKGHLALDLQNPKYPFVRALTSGTVFYAGQAKQNNGKQSPNGYVVILEHELADIKFYSFYAHMRPESINVKKGDFIQTGQLLGLMGHTNSSDNSNMIEHVHYSLFTGEPNSTANQPGYYRVNGVATTFGQKDYMQFGKNTYINPFLEKSKIEMIIALVAEDIQNQTGNTGENEVFTPVDTPPGHTIDPVYES